MNRRLFFWSLTSALAGFLFGFDTVVISGAEQTIEALWELTPFVHGLAMSAALWGTVLGSFVGSWPTNRFGRKPTLLWIGILYFVSAVWSALATDVYSFMVARFIGGLGVGISTVAAPMYISEIAPPGARGRLAGMFQFNIVFGILIAFMSNALLANVGENAWRWMLGVEALPALIYALLCLSLPESPRWLIGIRGDRESGRAVLEMIDPDREPIELDRIVDQISRSTEKAVAAKEPFFSHRLMTPILLAFLIAMFNQMSGINAILYFAPRIFALTGLGTQAALLQSVGIGITNLIFTFVGLWLIDKLGRRTLLFIGSFGYIASLGLAAYAFFAYAAPFNVATKAIALQEALQDDVIDGEGMQTAKADLVVATTDEGYDGEPIEFLAGTTTDELREVADQVLETAARQSANGGLMVLFAIFAFIAAHAIGQGTVIWVFISEIFPNQHRAAGQSLGSFTHWIFAATLTLVFPVVITKYAPGYVFGFFCGMMLLQLLWVWAMVPETKGVPLEEMERKLGIHV